ncbi:LIC_13387 family protein [Leptospira kmetyi]|uniref:LIC_13387 family protein n=1 Tax=Leptospira kmetyi TaxID=408139 RepID=UPI0010827347|nr:hypothetical protein [Leptospira kmetyi]TGK16320.1 hypothetical protein EHO62_11280 [Leptospira kmetyi]TGK34277.1 hypothetical protein EHO66_02655 [Leptospira kmetyi]
MKARLLIRIASALMLVFVVGHSTGHFTRYNTVDARALSTISAMQQTKIPMEGVDRSYDQFYTGMSLNLSIVLISLVVLLWFLADLSESNPRAALKLLIPVFFCIAGFAVTGFIYFFIAPAAISTLGALCLLVGIFLLRKD